MKDYKKLFSKYWGYGEQDTPICWACNQAIGVDIHHLISKGMGGVKNNRLNRIDNLFLVCRSCHTLAHQNKSKNEEYKQILLERIKLREAGYV
tara:strand:+ start:1831 stop:2109 length:279 start_codon:yes stop_codon:yes gene_type:complete